MQRKCQSCGKVFTPTAEEKVCYYCRRDEGKEELIKEKKEPVLGDKETTITKKKWRYQRKCIICGVEFTTNRHNQITCGSGVCMAKNSRRLQAIYAENNRKALEDMNERDREDQRQERLGREAKRVDKIELCEEKSKELRELFTMEGVDIGKDSSDRTSVLIGIKSESISVDKMQLEILLRHIEKCGVQCHTCLLKYWCAGEAGDCYSNYTRWLGLPESEEK